MAVMTAEDVMLINELLETEKTNEWETKVFNEWLNKYERFGHDTRFSDKQKSALERAKARILEGKEVSLYPEKVLKYDNCELVEYEDGWAVEINGRVGKPVSKRIGVIVLEWLTDALDDIYQDAGVEMGETKEVTEEEAINEPEPEIEEPEIVSTETDPFLEAAQEVENELADGSMPF